MDADTPALTSQLLDWYRAEPRDLPWRRTRDPYRILVSELMLQQTQVARVVPAYERFLERFPTVRALAAASPADVLRAWQGLGYNRRALSLHAAARMIADRHDGAIPDDLAALLRLPGVGEYTARAVLAFAFGADAAAVDTNVGRVLERAVTGRALPRAALQALADSLVPPGDASDWGQALMDLGARHCTARRPRCQACPLTRACAWRVHGGPDPAARARGAQPAFASSDRFHRGRIVDALRDGALDDRALADAARLDHDPGRLERVVAGLVADGLAARDGAGSLRLPGDQV